MGLVKIEGKEVSLDDRIIDAGIDAVRAALSVDFPDTENADIVIVRPITVGAPKTATVVKRGTGKGQGGAMHDSQSAVVAALMGAPEYVNPAISLSVEAMRQEQLGNTGFLDLTLRFGEIERAISAGEREGEAVQKAIAACGHSFPVASRSVPEGF